VSRVLFVEGATDVAFLHRLLRSRPGLADVALKPPREFGSRNTATTMPAVLAGVLLPQLQVGAITALGIISDADHPPEVGFDKRWQRLTAPLREAGYRVPSPPVRRSLGTVVGHPDGLPSVGLWIMPDHQSDGALEDMIAGCVTDGRQSQLLQHAERTVDALPDRLFGSSQRSKAAVYSWLAWQRRPGLGLSMAADAEIIDETVDPLRGMLGWLERTFA
jgi:hypothetical protein